MTSTNGSSWFPWLINNLKRVFSSKHCYTQVGNRCDFNGDLVSPIYNMLYMHAIRQRNNRKELWNHPCCTDASRSVSMPVPLSPNLTLMQPWVVSSTLKSQYFGWRQSLWEWGQFDRYKQTGLFNINNILMQLCPTNVIDRTRIYYSMQKDGQRPPGNIEHWPTFPSQTKHQTTQLFNKMTIIHISNLVIRTIFLSQSFNSVELRLMFFLFTLCTK
jgi:hypothetical protein